MKINEKIANLSPEKRALLELKLKNKKLKDIKASKYQKISPRNNKERAPLSFAQQRLWFLELLESNSDLYHLKRAVRLTGEINTQVLQQSLDAIVARHEIFRTNYITDQDEPIQIIAPPQSVELKLFDLQGDTKQQQESEVIKVLYRESQRSFNLESDIMLRGCLLQLNSQEHILILIMHHIVSDAWSIDILWQQLTQVYQAFLKGEPNPLPELPIQYADYAVWQREWLRGEILDKQLNYWRDRLTDVNPLLELPQDHPRPAVPTYRGARQSLDLPQTLIDSLQRLCRQEGVTLYMTLLTTFATLLHRYTGQKDITIGSPVANRNRAEIQQLIGLFINTIVLRTKFTAAQTFRSLLTQVKEIAIDAYAHQDLPFEKLVEELKPERSLSYHPLFQVFFNMINLEKTQPAILGLKTEPLSIQDTVSSKFDLTLYAIEKQPGFQLALDYNTDLFTRERMVEMLNQYHHLLSQIARDPDQLIGSYSLVTAKSQKLLPNLSSILPESDYPSVTTKFINWAKRTPEQTAISQGTSIWSYSELHHSAENIAKVLLAFGVQKGDTVGVFGTRCFGLIASMMGVFLSGGVLLNIDPKLPSNRQQIMLKEAKVKYLLNIGSEVSAAQKSIGESVINISIASDTGKCTSCQGEFDLTIALPEIKSHDAAYIFFTSGTTGVPKGVLGCHKSLFHFLNWQKQRFQIGEQDRIAQLTALSFDVVLRDIFLPLTSGATLCLPQEENILEPIRILSWLEQEQISAFHTVPSLGQSWLTSVPSEVSLRNLRWLFFAGEPLQETLVSKWRKTFPQSGEIVNLYGPTETTLAKCYYPIPAQPISGIQPVGFPLPETQALVLQQDNQLCGIGEEGEIVIRTPFRTLGYINAAEEQSSRFVQNPLRNDEGDLLYYTGDRGRYRPDGSLEILGRLDRQVKIRGVRIELREIEAVISQHPDVHCCEIIAEENITSGKRLVAYIVAHGETNPTTSGIRNFLKQQLPEYMIPSSFMFLETMPLTPNGKVDRQALPTVAIASETEESFAPPTEEIELKLTKIWSEVLGLNPIGIKDNFFDLGGHSLLAVKLFAQIEKILGISLPLSTLFTAPTIQQLADLLRQSEWTAPWHLLVPIQTKGDRPPLFCVHGGGFNVLIYRELALNLGTEQPVYGLQSKGLDGKTTPHSTIEDMATDYIKFIQTIQPIGPYFICGLSNGGRIALEMAQQLQQQGQKVDLLAMFDSHGPGALQLLPPVPRLVSVVTYALRYNLPRFVRKYIKEPAKIVVNLRDLVSNDHEFSKLQNSQANQDRRSSIQNNYEKRKNHFEAIFDKFHRFILNHSPVGFYGQNLHALPVTLQKNNQIFKQARKRYVPKAYSGSLTVFQASEQPPGFEVDSQFGWGEIAMGGLKIHKIPGHHSTIVGSPILAEKIKLNIDGVLEKYGSSVSTKQKIKH